MVRTMQWTELNDPTSWDIIDPMSGIDQKTGTICLYDLIPQQGDSLVVVNCGTHFEIRYQHTPITPPLDLTDEDIEKLRKGEITWQ